MPLGGISRSQRPLGPSLTAQRGGAGLLGTRGLAAHRGQDRHREGLRTGSGRSPGPAATCPLYLRGQGLCIWRQAMTSGSHRAGSRGPLTTHSPPAFAPGRQRGVKDRREKRRQASGWPRARTLQGPASWAAGRGKSSRAAKFQQKLKGKGAGAKWAGRPWPGKPLSGPVSAGGLKTDSAAHIQAC